MISIATVYEVSATILTSATDHSDIPVAAVVPQYYDDDGDGNYDESTTRNDDWQDRLQSVLEQRRDIINFKDYAVSEEHVKRMQELAQALPEVFANPAKTQRSQWFSHPNYDTNNQMPNLHVHYRLEMQGVLFYLQKAYRALKNGASPPHSILLSAFRQFKGSMEGLHHHVAVEEWKLFPVFQLNYDLDLKFLHEDHEHLHQTESRLFQALSYLKEASSSSSSSEQRVQEAPDDLEEQLVGAIQLALDFDQQLLSHLGEEEEIVVPMSLSLEGRLKY